MMQARLSITPEVPGFGYFTPSPAVPAKPSLTLVQRAKPATPLDQMYAYFTAE